jgi:hypothetical protein
MNLFRKGAAMVLAAVFSVSVAQAGSADPTIKDLEDSLAHKGARATLAKYFDCGTGTGWKLVASGDAAALKVGMTLFRTAHGCEAETMLESFSLALTANPTVMMRYIKNRSDLSTNLCGAPLIDNLAKAQLTEAFDAAKRAYLSVTDPSLTKIKQACLAKLEEDRAVMLP